MADDDPDDRAIIKDAIETIHDGDIIRFAENGREALEILGQEYDEDNQPCLIVLDLNMPKLNGTETLRKLKNDDRFSRIPVIIFSTSVNTFEREKCILLGAHSYITKPLSYKECMETAHAFLRFCESASVS